MELRFAAQVLSRFPQDLVSNCKIKRVFPGLSTRTLSFTFQVASTMVLTPVRDSDWPELVPAACECDPCPPKFKLSKRV